MLPCSMPSVLNLTLTVTYCLPTELYISVMYGMCLQRKHGFMARGGDSHVSEKWARVLWAVLPSVNIVTQLYQANIHLAMYGKDTLKH